MEQREMVEALRTDFSVRQICETLGFTRSNLYYHPKQDPCEAGLRDEIEKLSLLYPTYGYRRITQLLVRSGYTLGYKTCCPIDEIRQPLGFCQTCLSNHDIRCGCAVPGAIALKTLMSPDVIRSGWAILHTSVSKDTSSMYVCSWMSSLAGSEGGISVNT